MAVALKALELGLVAVPHVGPLRPVCRLQKRISIELDDKKLFVGEHQVKCFWKTVLHLHHRRLMGDGLFTL